MNVSRQSLFLTFLLVVAFLILCQIRGGSYPLPGEEMAGALGPLGLWMESFRICCGSLFDILTAMVLFINAFYVTQIVTSNRVLGALTYSPALFYIVASCSLYRPGTALSAALASFLLIAGIVQMIGGFKRQPTYDRFFKASLFLGTAPLFYAPAAIGFPALLAGVLFFRRGWREMVIGLAGYLLPFTTASYIEWVRGEPLPHLFWEMAESLRTPTGFSLWENTALLPLLLLGLLAALTLLSLTIFIIHAKDSRARARRIFYYFAFLLFITLGLFFLPSHAPADFILLAASLSVVISNVFVRYSGTIPALVWLLVVLGAVWVNLAPMIC